MHHNSVKSHNRFGGLLVSQTLQGRSVTDSVHILEDESFLSLRGFKALGLDLLCLDIDLHVGFVAPGPHLFHDNFLSNIVNVIIASALHPAEEIATIEFGTREIYFTSLGNVTIKY